MLQQMTKWRQEWFVGAPADSATDSAAERNRREEKVRGLLRSDDELLGRAYDERLVRRLIHYLQPYRNETIISIVFMIISASMVVAAPWIIGHAFDNGISAGDYTALRFWTLVFLTAVVVELVTNRTRIYLMAKVGTHVVANIRRDLYLQPARTTAGVSQQCQRRALDQPAGRVM
jgi:ABC-type bacteriocin/lantibiotic exporter with double-glycine peptidase domain